MRTNREFRRRKRNEQDDKGTTEVTSREDTLPAENTLPAEKHISESAGDTSEPHTSLSPRNRDVFVEAQTGHVVFNGNDDDDDDDDDEPDDFYLWAVWLYVCSGCKHEFQDDHRCRPSRPESGRTASGSSESAARAGEYLYASHKPYGLPQPPVCKSLSNRIAEEEGEGEGDHTRYGGHEDERRRRNCCGNGGNLSSKVTGGEEPNGVNPVSDPNAPLEAAAAYMFGYRLCCRLRGRGLHNHRGWLAPDLMLNFAADSFTQDKHYLIQLYGKILGIVRRPGAFSGVVPVPEVGMVNRVDDAARNTKSVRVISVLMATKHDVYPSVVSQKNAGWGYRQHARDVKTS
ncbi:hypothetical protein NEUTE2DRAFT_136161 [Neurospora tetrasperma FGSC 2509]|nr:hypothetical protein NEUTE2DRAFT_136161 [Neurospora tetrasperma FGSC 2509]